MTVIEHLEELRYRVLLSLIAFLVGSIVSYIFYYEILQIIRQPFDQTSRVGGIEIRDVPLYAQGIAGPFLLRIKVSAFSGFLLSLPVLLYHLWRFITPGLEPNEKKYAIPFVASSLVLFAGGAYFAFLMLPAGIRFLLGFAGPPLAPFITFQDYLSFLILMVMAFGLSFEFPLLLIFLALVGIIDSARLRKSWRLALLGAFLVGAVATPSQDPFSQVVLSVPLYILYELSILVIRYVLKR